MALEVEKEFFEANYERFHEKHSHEWVVISGQKILDFFDRFETAALVAIQELGNAPFLIRQIDAPAVHLPFVIISPE